MSKIDAAPALPSVLPPEEDAAAQAPGVTDDLAFKENAWLEDALSGHTIEAARLKNSLVEAHIANLEADRKMRVTYAGRILRYLEFYSGGVAALLVAGGIGWHFTLPTEILAALVGSTAVAAIGLVGFIARGLFRSPPPPPST